VEIVGQGFEEIRVKELRPTAVPVEPIGGGQADVTPDRFERA
jgi:hypothetical protein